MHGEPIRFGADGQLGVVRDTATGGVRSSRSPRRDADVLVHDAHAADPTTAFAISRLTDAGLLNHAPIGIFRQVEAATYDDQAREQIVTASQGTTDQADALAGLLGSRRHLDRRLTHVRRVDASTLPRVGANALLRLRSRRLDGVVGCVRADSTCPVSGIGSLDP